MVYDALVCEENHKSTMSSNNQDEESSRYGRDDENREGAGEEDPDERDEIENENNEKENDNRDNCSPDSDESNLEATRCHEKMPSSDSNKENRSSVSNCVVEYNTNVNDEDDKSETGEYENSDKIPFPELLKIHPKQLVSGFEFGEATKRRAQENMKSARDKSLEENRKSGEITAIIGNSEDFDSEKDLDKPCCSKTLSEKEHKTPHSYKRQRLIEGRKNMTSADIDFCKTIRGVPECIKDYPDCVEVWVYMIYKEEAAIKLRNPRLFNDFKSVTPRMRAILLDWLMEVAEVYHLRRVTYYLAVDYFDRFLSIRPDIPKSLLQLVGITCLYIAAKVEEIYPPNLSEFAYVCDGACKAKDMVSCELLILNSLGWEVILTTPSDWLNLYMQLHHKSQDIVRTALNLDFNKDFLFPQYSAYQFTRASQLMDLLSLDPGFLKFSYSTIAATAMYYMYGEKIALGISGLTWEQMRPCAEYMDVFYRIVKDAPDPRLVSCLGGPHPSEVKGNCNGVTGRSTKGSKNENYSFQTHIASMDYFEKATIFRLSKLTRNRTVNVEKLKSTSKQEIKNSHEVGESTPVSSKNTVCGDSEEDQAPEDVTSNLVELGFEANDCGLLDSLAKEPDAPNSDESAAAAENLMSLDEIFELILNQDDNKSSKN